MKPYNRDLAGKDSVELARILLAYNIHSTMLNREQIHLIQEYRLRDMLRYAKKHSPWYAKRLQHIDPESFTLEDLTTIPIMNKRDLMENWDTIVTDKQLNFEQASAFLLNEQGYDLFHGYHLFASGGSSGRRGMFVWSSQDLAIFLYSLYRFQFRDEFHCSFSYTDSPIRVASVAALKPVHLSETLYSFPLMSNTSSRAYSAMDPINKLIEDLNDYQPTHLNGYPSVIANLANRAVKGELKIQPRRILVGSEPLLPEMVKMIKASWKNVVIANTWGSTDAGTHAISCDYSEGNLHVCEDLVVIEPVDNQNCLVKESECSDKILITSLYHKSLPIFRYEMDDRLKFANKTCACGSQMRLIHSIEGRSEDDFIYGTVVVSSEVFENTIMVEPGIDEYQVFQTEKGADVLIVPARNSEVNTQRMLTSLKEQFNKLGIGNPEIKIDLVQQLKRHAETGKLKRFKCLVK